MVKVVDILEASVKTYILFYRYYGGPLYQILSQTNTHNLREQAGLCLLHITDNIVWSMNGLKLAASSNYFFTSWAPKLFIAQQFNSFTPSLSLQARLWGRQSFLVAQPKTLSCWSVFQSLLQGTAEQMRNQIWSKPDCRALQSRLK